MWQLSFFFLACCITKPFSVISFDPGQGLGVPLGEELLGVELTVHSFSSSPDGKFINDILFSTRVLRASPYNLMQCFSMLNHHIFFDSPPFHLTQIVQRHINNSLLWVISRFMNAQRAAKIVCIHSNPWRIPKDLTFQMCCFPTATNSSVMLKCKLNRNTCPTETGHGASINTRCGHLSESIRTMDIGLKQNQATINRIRGCGTSIAVSWVLVRTRDLTGI